MARKLTEDLRQGSLLERRAADEIERLQKENHQLRVWLADKARTNMELWTTLQRIDGINDNPACFNADIDAVLTSALKSRP